MDETDRFISDGNIARFVDRLRTQSVPFVKEVLTRLLVEEDNGFGAAERLAGLWRSLFRTDCLLILRFDDWK
jgi:hypothetical protein